MSPPRLLALLRDRAAVKRYSPRTTQAYADWVRRFVRFHGTRHPRDLGVASVRDYLTYLARERGVSASTQNQALAALQFLYRDVLGEPLTSIEGVAPARVPHQLPNVLSRRDAHRVLAAMSGTPQLMARLMYGTGLRLMECCELRLKDLNFDRGEIAVRRGKGGRDRVTMLPEGIRSALRAQIREVQHIREQRLARGGGRVPLPGAFARKSATAEQQLAWWWLFPASRETRDATTGARYTYHLHQTVVQRAVAEAGRASGITQRVGCHTFRHCFGTHLAAANYDLRTIQELMGHADIATTMLYIHVLNRDGLSVTSPLDEDPTLDDHPRRSRPRSRR
jgi:integron integrase